MNENLPWIEKYRPSCFDDIVSQKNVLESLGKLIEKNSLSHMIFYGLPGTGKTTTILACAKKIYGSSHNSMVLELNGSDDRGIDIVRDKIKSFSNYSLSDNYVIKKLVILDEVDAMTEDAQFALRHVMDMYIKTTRFCLICNYLTKLLPALQSRCQLFIFLPIDKTDHLKKINSIINSEKILIDEESKQLIINLSDGDMRKSINLLQTVYMTSNQLFITKEIIFKLIGYSINEKNIIDNVIDSTQSINDIYSILANTCINVTDIIKELTNIIIRKKDLNKLKKIKFINTLAKIEINVTVNTNLRIHLYGICAAIYQLNH